MIINKLAAFFCFEFWKQLKWEFAAFKASQLTEVFHLFEESSEIIHLSLKYLNNIVCSAIDFNHL